MADTLSDDVLPKPATKIDPVFFSSKCWTNSYISNDGSTSKTIERQSRQLVHKIRLELNSAKFQILAFPLSKKLALCKNDFNPTMKYGKEKFSDNYSQTEIKQFLSCTL